LASDSSGLPGGFSGQRAWVRIFKKWVEKKEMTFRQVTKEEKGPNIAVRSPIAEKRRRESEEKEKVKVGF
jgi:hypothetical protein